MSDYSTIQIKYNVGTDATPNFTSTALAFGGSGGANELRFAGTGAGATGSTASASWPYTTRPASGTAPVDQLWAFTTNTSGNQVATYDGTNGKARVLQLDFSADGTFASAPRWSAFANNTHPTPVAGTQTSNPTDGSNIINGQATDTSSTSYLKGNAYGSGMTTAGGQETPSAGAAGTTLLVTSGTAGAATPSAGSWLATWQSLQGWTQYIQAPAIPKTSTSFQWYVTLALFMGVNMVPGVMPFSPIVFDYTYA